MIGISTFIAKVKEIASRPLVYRTGGVGKDGSCDCIGLIMGAMYELGHKKYDLHSTNYFARYQTMELRNVKESDLHVGMILYKTRANSGSLGERYKPGGAHYTGDLLDYYHVGVVTGIRPLEITECTEYGNVTGIVVSKKFNGWDCGGMLRGVLYEDYDADNAVEEATMYQAIVSTEKDPLRVREWAVTGTILGSVPKGKNVDVLEDAGDGWLKIRYNELTGYASGAYLQRVQSTNVPEESEPDVAELTVRTIIKDESSRVFEPVGSFTVETVIEVGGESID